MPNKIVNVEGRTLSVPMDATPDEIDELTRPKLDPTTAGQANSLAPAFTPKPDDVSGMMQQDAPGIAEQAGMATMRHYGNIADNAGRIGDSLGTSIAHGLGLPDPTPGSDAAADSNMFTGNKPSLLQPDRNSAVESATDKLEGVGDYMLPAARADKAIIGSVGEKGLPSLAARMAGGAATNAGVSALHGDVAPKSLAENAALGTVGPLAGYGMKAATPSVTRFLLRNLVKNTPENPGVTSAVGDLVNRPFTKGGLLNKVSGAASDADTAANSALSNYSGPNFDARPGLQMIEDAKNTAAAQGHPQEYIDSLNQLGDAIRNKTGLDATGKTVVASRTNPANLGLKKFQDTIARVNNVPADMAGDVSSKLSSQLDNVPEYADANNARNSLGEATSQLSAPTPPAAPKTMLQKVAEYLPYISGAGGGGLLGHGNPVDMAIGAAVGAGVKGLAKGVPALYNSAPANTAALVGFKQLAPGAAKLTAAGLGEANDNSTVMVKLPNGQVGHIQRWEVLNALHNGATLLQ